MSNNNYLRSINDIAEFIGCSLPTAQKIKNNFPEIVHQYGRKFLINTEDLLNALKLK
jgi:quinolinate synthase